MADEIEKEKPASAQPTPEELAAQAGETAPSPTNELPEPTDAQIEAGNYKKGHVKYEGLDISIENDAGSVRRKEWAPLAHHYGDIKLSEGADGDPVDVFINKDNDPSANTPVFPINQINQQTGQYDETKIMLGFATKEEAVQGYLDNYPEGWKTPDIVPEFTTEELKNWLRYGDTKTSWDAPATEASPAAQEEAKKAAKRRATAQKEYKGRLFPDEDTDDLITYVRKLGGIDVDFETDLKGRLSHLNKKNNIFGLPPIERTGGKGLTLDRLGEALISAGYLKADPNIGNGVDSAALMDLLFQAESEPVYTPTGQEAASKTEIDARYEEEVAEYWANFTDETTEFNRVDSELARLMSLAGGIDHDTMVDIASKDISDEDVRALLQAFIDETEQTTTEAGATAEDQAGGTDVAAPTEAEAEPETDETQPDLIGKTDEEVAEQAIVDAKAEKDTTPDERPDEAQSSDDLFAQDGKLEPDLFAPDEVAEPTPGAGQTLEQVLESSQQPTTDSTPLKKIKLTAETEDAKVTHNAGWWVKAVDKRIRAVNDLRTCA